MKKTLLLLLFCSSSVLAQLTDQQFLQAYRDGLTLFKEERYEEALQKLSTLTTRNHANAVAPYASLYAAQAAERSGNKYQAKVLYRNLFTYYPEWDKLDEARILYAKVNLQDGYFDEGLKALHEVSSPTLNAAKMGLMEDYLKNVKTVTALKNLYQKYPNYRPLAKALVDKIQSNRFNSKADLELSDMLTNRFNLLQTQPSGSAAPSKGNTLHFGLLLPFELSSSDPGSFRYIYDLYAGMAVAVDKLAQKDIFVQLHPYDVKSDATAYKNAEKKPGFAELDVVVGPLYPAPNALVQQFVADQQVIHVHPTSNNLTLLEGAKRTFLMQPSHTHQAKKVLDYAASTGLPKTVSIYYGEARKDSVFAYIYAEEAKRRGYKVTALEKYTGQDLKAEKGHVFLAADNNLGVRFLQGVAISNLDCEVIVTASSFNWERMNTSIFTDRVALIYPEFVNRERENVLEFEKTYFDKVSGLPTYYSYLGHDLVYYFGSMLKDGEKAFDKNVGRGEYIDDYLLSGYDFSHKIKQNEVVPIVKFREHQFEEVYR